MIHPRNILLPAIALAIAFAGGCAHIGNARDSGNIRPWPENPYYWEYKGRPVMLIGGSKDDNLFQETEIEAHLDTMLTTGANYIRNTMSGRDDGNVQPFLEVRDGVYDLGRWNDEYWRRFENMLRLTAERDIIVQIEMWAFHDFYGEWEEYLPWNPKYNINYTAEETRLDPDGYGSYWETCHDFFYTVPALHNDVEVLRYQQAFVDKLLTHTLDYGHVLYCITNEIFTQYSPEWGWYWSRYIHERAREAGVIAQVAEMYQNHDLTHSQHRATLDHPEIYDFIDISQNSIQIDDIHWERLQWVRGYIADNSRPVNHTKTYGGDEVDWTDGDAHGIERMWRNLIGGAASTRFHRPPAGLGLNAEARQHIRSMRLLLEKVDIFSCEPDSVHSLLVNRGPDEAYLTRYPGSQYALYFPQGGAIGIDLSGTSGAFDLWWLDIEEGEWRSPHRVSGGSILPLDTPDDGPWAAALIRRDN